MIKNKLNFYNSKNYNNYHLYNLVSNSKRKIMIKTLPYILYVQIKENMKWFFVVLKDILSISRRKKQTENMFYYKVKYFMVN